MATAYASLTLSGAARALLTTKAAPAFGLWRPSNRCHVTFGAMHLRRTLTPTAWLFAQLFCFNWQRRLNRLVMAGFAY